MTKIIQKIGKHNKPVTKTKDGKPVTGLQPVESDKMQDSIIGAMTGSVRHFHHPFAPTVESTDWNATKPDA